MNIINTLIIIGVVVVVSAYFYLRNKSTVRISESKNTEYFYDPTESTNQPIGSFAKYVCSEYKAKELQNIVEVDRIR